MNTVLNNPLFFITALGIILAIVAFLGAWHTRGVFRIGLSVVGSICLLFPVYVHIDVFAPELIDARYRSYKALYADIQTGMTRDQVLATVDKHYPAGGPRKRPTIMRDTANELGFFMNPEDSYEPNCEGIFLDFRDGKVTKKDYSKD